MDKQWNDFNFNDFRKWINSQKDDSPAKKCENKFQVGTLVESKVSIKKIIARMEIQEGEEEEVAKEFKQKGGTISEIDENEIMIDVDSGSFIIHKAYVRAS